MKIKFYLNFQLFKSVFAAFLILFLSLSLFTACSSADASKKDKSKKSKSKAEPEEEEEESTDNEKESDDPKEKEKAEKKESAEPKEKEKAEKKEPAEPKVSPDKLWEDLIKGNKRFMDGKHTTVNYASMRESLVKGQKPKVIVLGCADSRVPPEFVFDKNLGELFVIREAGNIADEVSLGSIEYAVEHLHAQMIVVLGHESCGAVAAAVSGKKMPTKNLTEIVDMITPAFEGSKDCLIGKEPKMACVELNAEHSAADLLSKSSVIKKAVEAGELTIVSAVYHFDTGEVAKLK